ncbi:hypothetical protein F5Y19DRAFT_280347 [Xylariaceae sp. FL1651]|nr:hypothetical protein F5Y19DRAFT_280347 [Xylariaceae sp. FL1651]
MALEIGAANALNLGGSEWFVPRVVDDYGAKLEARQTSNGDTVNLFIDALDSDYEYDVSVVAACATQTVYAIQCTAGSAGSATCGPNAPTVTATENASQYKVSSTVATSTLGYKVVVGIQEECNLDGTTAATCTATASLSANGQQTKTSYTSIITGADYTDKRFDVTVTGGAEKLANPTGKCSAASGLNTRVMALWSLLGAVGAIGVLAL